MFIVGCSLATRYPLSSTPDLSSCGPISLAQQRMCMESGDRTSHDRVNDDTTASCWSLVGNIDSKGAIVAHIIN